MTRTFDSGLEAPIRTMIGEGIRGLLAPLSRASGQFARAIQRYPGIIPKHVDDSYEITVLEDILNGAAPAYAVGIGDLKAKPGGATGSALGTYEIEVYSVTNHMRQLVLGRLEQDAAAIASVAADPGIEVMVELVRMYLFGQHLGTKPASPSAPPTLYNIASPLYFDGERSVFNGRELSIWASEFHIDVTLESNLHRGADQYITSVLFRHHLGTNPVPVADVASTPVVETQFPVP